MAVRIMPDCMVSAFTLGHKIPVVGRFYDDSCGAKRVWDISYLRHVALMVAQGPRDFGPYRGCVDMFKQMFDAIPVRGGRVAVIGSQSPWLEMLALDRGAANVTTVDYQEIACADYPGLRTTLVPDFEQSEGVYDFILSYSSIEHSGLGRYGDPLDPDGDIKSVAMHKQKMAPGGVMAIGVPVGKDILFWNEARLYGPIRLPLLTDGLEMIGHWGPDPKMLMETLNTDAGQQPLMAYKIKQ